MLNTVLQINIVPLPVTWTEKYKKPTSQITFSAVTIKQQIKKSYNIQRSQCKNEFNVLVQVFPLHGLSTIFPA